MAKSDWRNIAIIIGASLLAVLLLSPVHQFSYVDDWIYADVAKQIIAGDGFKIHQLSQATLVSHAYWGALFGWLLGFNFTSLTFSTLTMAMIGLITFYLLQRRLNLSSNLSLLGTAVLGLNPTYLRHSYTYMTDITFAALLLLSALLYLEGLSGRERWLWLGSGVAALAFLTRQFGLAVPLAATLWLLYNRQLNVRRLLAVALVPLLVTITYFAWRSLYPPVLADSFQQQIISSLVQNPIDGLSQRLINLLLSVSLLSLTLPLFSRIRWWWMLLIWAALLGTVVYTFVQVSSPDTSSVAVQVESNGVGLSNTVWYWLGAGIAACLLTIMSQRCWAGRHYFARRSQPLPLIGFFYIIAIIMFAGVFLTTGTILARYWLPFIPFIIVLLLEPMRTWSRQGLVALWLVVLLVGSYSIATHYDEFNLLDTRWQAGEYLLTQGVSKEKIDNGFAWNGYHLFDEAMSNPQLHVLDIDLNNYPFYRVTDPEYVVALSPIANYQVIKQFSYFSILDGFTTHQVFVQQRHQPLVLMTRVIFLRHQGK